MMKTTSIRFHILSLVFGVYFWKGFEANVAQELESCYQKNTAICDPSEILQPSGVLRLQSEINTWELVLSSLQPKCPACYNSNDRCNTVPKVYIFNGIQELDYSFLRKNNIVVVSGRCNNNNVAFVFESCSSQMRAVLSTLMPKNKPRLEASVQETPHSAGLPTYISNFVRWYFNMLALDDTQNMLAKTKLFWKVDKQGSSCLTTSINIFNFKNNITEKQKAASSNATGIPPIQAFNMTNAAIRRSEDHLVTHHSHHGLTNNILTIIAALIGSGALSLLLCFRRVRHFICSICTLCRSADDFRSLLADPDA